MPTLDQANHQTAVRRPGAGSRTDSQERPRRRRGHADGSAAVAAFHALLAEESGPGADLLPPPTPARHVPRPRLLRRLQGAEEASVILLAAPAGYGKSTLLSDWAQRESRPVAWLTLTALDNDPELLLERLSQRADPARRAMARPGRGGRRDGVEADRPRPPARAAALAGRDAERPRLRPAAGARRRPQPALAGRDADPRGPDRRRLRPAAGRGRLARRAAARPRPAARLRTADPARARRTSR